MPVTRRQHGGKCPWAARGAAACSCSTRTPERCAVPGPLFSLLGPVSRSTNPQGRFLTLRSLCAAPAHARRKSPARGWLAGAGAQDWGRAPSPGQCRAGWGGCETLHVAVLLEALGTKPLCPAAMGWGILMQRVLSPCSPGTTLGHIPRTSRFWGSSGAVSASIPGLAPFPGHEVGAADGHQTGLTAAGRAQLHCHSLQPPRGCSWEQAGGSGTDSPVGPRLGGSGCRARCAHPSCARFGLLTHGAGAGVEESPGDCSLGALFAHPGWMGRSVGLLPRWECLRLAGDAGWTGESWDWRPAVAFPALPWLPGQGDPVSAPSQSLVLALLPAPRCGSGLSTPGTAVPIGPSTTGTAVPIQEGSGMARSARPWARRHGRGPPVHDTWPLA